MNLLSQNIFNSNIVPFDLLTIEQPTSNITLYSKELFLRCMDFRNEFSFSVGLVSSENDLLSLAHKEKLIVICNNIVSLLLGIDREDKKMFQRTFKKAIDNAEQSLLIVFEFTHFSTLLTVKSVPYDFEKQRTLHAREPYTNTVQAFNTVSVFNKVQTSDNLFNASTSLINLSSFDTFDAFNSFCRFHLDKNKSNTGITIRLDSDPVIKKHQIDLIAKVTETEFDKELNLTANEIIIEYKSLNAMFKPYCFLK